MGFSYGFVVDI